MILKQMYFHPRPMDYCIGKHKFKINQFVFEPLSNMFLKLFLLLLLNSFTYGIVFDGKCSEVPRNVTKREKFVNMKVFYYTEIESPLNSFFEHLGSLGSVILNFEKSENDFLIRKATSVTCVTHDHLEYLEDFGYYKHSILTLEHNRFFVEFPCKSYWDRYQLLIDFGSVIVWGCVDHPGGRTHEEALWEFQRDDFKSSFNWMPVGRITQDHLLRTPISRKPGIPLTSLECKNIKPTCRPRVRKQKYIAEQLLCSAAIVMIICVVVVIRVKK